MKDESKLLAALGLCMRAGRMVTGEDTCERMIRRHKVALMLLEGSASQNTRKRFANACAHHNVPCYLAPEGADIAIGKTGRKAMGIIDARFAQMMLESDTLILLDSSTRGGGENGKN